MYKPRYSVSVFSRWDKSFLCTFVCPCVSTMVGARVVH